MTLNQHCEVHQSAVIQQSASSSREQHTRKGTHQCKLQNPLTSRSTLIQPIVDLLNEKYRAPNPYDFTSDEDWEAENRFELLAPRHASFNEYRADEGVIAIPDSALDLHLSRRAIGTLLWRSGSSRGDMYWKLEPDELRAPLRFRIIRRTGWHRDHFETSHYLVAACPTMLPEDAAEFGGPTEMDIEAVRRQIAGLVKFMTYHRNLLDYLTF
jgi:hypothetical protein